MKTISVSAAEPNKKTYLKLEDLLSLNASNHQLQLNKFDVAGHTLVQQNEGENNKIVQLTGGGFWSWFQRNKDPIFDSEDKLFEDTNKQWKIFPEVKIEKPNYYEFLINKPEENWEEQKKNKYATLEIEMSEDLRSVPSDGLKEFLEKNKVHLEMLVVNGTWKRIDTFYDYAHPPHHVAPPAPTAESTQ